MAKAHSKLGASKAERWLHCPGSVSLCETVPPAPSSHYADEGSAAHYFAERALLEGLELDDMLGEVCPDYPDWPLTREMAEAVGVYVDHCRALYMDALGEVPGVEYAIEHRFALSEIDDELFGTVDFYALFPVNGHLAVRDYKHGAGVLVSPVQNAQASYYALGAIQAAHAAGLEVESVSIGIIQPRAPGKAVKIWEPSLRWLADFAETLRHGVEATRQPDAPLSAGEWCRWCDAKPICPKYRPPAGTGNWAGARDRSANADFAELPDLDNLLGD